MISPIISRDFSVSTWSLHRTIGLRYEDRGSDRVAIPEWGSGTASLLDIPAQAKAHGIGQVEICHFHFAETSPGYLAEIRGAFADAGVNLMTLLIDEGDITHPDATVRERHMESILRWLGVAGTVGAARARVIAGDAAPDPGGVALALSAANLKILTAFAAERGVRIVVENWHPLLDRPAELLQLFDMLQGEIGLLLDFGNWHGERKYADLAKIAHLTESTHAKANYIGGVLDTADYDRCLQICADAGFTGPHSLIFDSSGDEWTEIVKLREYIETYRPAP